MKIINKTISCFLTIMLLVFIPISAYSMDADFINRPERWYDNADVVYTPYQQSDFNGIYGYSIDSENACFYLHISYSEASMKDNDNEIKVDINISNSISNYVFTIDENGIVESDSSTKSAFKVVSNFGNATRQGQELFLGIEFRNKSDKTLDNTILFSVCVNGKIYDLNSGLLLPFYVEETTKNKAGSDKTTTKKDSKTTTKNTAEKTTKFKYVAPVKSSSSKSYDSDNVTNDNDSYEQNGETEEYNSNNQIITDFESEETLSEGSKMLVVVSAVFISVGSVAGVYYYNKARTASKKSKEKSENET